MKSKIICLLLPLFLLSCSKKSPEAERRANIQPAANLPFQITVLVTPESNEQKDIKDQVTAFFKNQAYEKLDEFAAKFRVSRESYADGTWKLGFIYDALDTPEQTSDAAWAAHKADIQKWVQTKPESVTARIVMARFLRNYAWQARGSGYANTVTDENWKFFGERLNQAVEVLKGAKKLNEKCPVYWSTMLGVALGLQASKEQFNSIFKQAIQAEPDYHFYYRTRAVFLLPRWYGEAGEWESDLAQSADRIGGEEGDMLYAQVAWGIHQYGETIDVFDEKKISWERVNRGFAVILKQFPGSLAAKNERAHLAALAGDKEKAREYFAQTEGKVDLSVWNAKDEFIDAANWAFSP